MLGDDDLPPTEHSVTIEEVPAGRIPDWLKQHIRLQSLGKPINDSNRHGRILILYPTEKSKRQALSSIDSEEP